MKALTERSAARINLGLAALFFVLTSAASCARWANYEYRTFDLAFYVQGTWQFLHGRFDVSLLGVPLLGNHVEPIVFLFAPLFAVVRHPLVFVLVQNAALALMGPLGFRIARRLDLDPLTALFASAALFLCPAAAYVALHEFHPEALSAPLLLLLFEARLAGAIRRYWICFLLVLACKENMALLLMAYCVIQAIATRPRDWARLRSWYFWPLLVAMAWLFVCVFLISPLLNTGNVDYLSLYNRLGNSVPDILRNFVVRPQLAGTALGQALAHGNLLWALLLCFAGLPLLRPRWLLIAAPVLLQHLLSWRSSEWTVYFHYAAPLLPFFWMAAAEGIAGPIRKAAQNTRFSLLGPAALLLTASVVSQGIIGPFPAVAEELASYPGKARAREQKNLLVRQIAAEASVVAPLPYLSHLAMRERLYSLHFILKGLKTLSHQRYQPPAPTDYVLIDYDDSATFDVSAGYYHPPMRTNDGSIIPASDDLLHAFLAPADWATHPSGRLLLLKNQRPGTP